MKNNRGGFTLIEVIMGTALAGLVMLGLAVVYLLGVDAWGRTSSRVALQRTASSALYELTRDIQRADSIEIFEGGRVLYCRIPPFYIDSTPPTTVLYTLTEEQLIKKNNENSFNIVPEEPHDSLKIELLEGIPLFRYSNAVPVAPHERVIDINFQIVHQKEKIKEIMPFTTTVGARNL